LAGTALRLYPLPAREIPSSAIYEDIALLPARRRDPSRPYVGLNVVASVDGKTTLEGKASRIGSEADRRAMRTLRSKVDAVMIGSNTLRAEKLSLGLDEYSSGREPLAVIVTKSGDVPLETNLVASDRQEVLAIVAQGTPESNLEGLRGHAGVLRVPPAASSGGVDIEAALAALKAERGVERVLVEGGPSVNYSLVSRGLADELFLTLSPKLIGGEARDALTLLQGAELPLSRIPRLLLVSIHLWSDELYLRYRLAGQHQEKSA
jgi:riboflavin-specific deaminase-like protein